MIGDALVVPKSVQVTRIRPTLGVPAKLLIAIHGLSGKSLLFCRMEDDRRRAKGDAAIERAAHQYAAICEIDVSRALGIQENGAAQINPGYGIGRAEIGAAGDHR